jgi:sialate O-acetylesterase
VQLPNYKPRTEDPGAPSNWAVVREAMRKSLALPNTGMAVIIDAGEAKNIHPKDKQIVGQRLALWARAEVYGEPIPHAGPLLAGHEIRGNEVMLSFTHTDGGLVARGGDLKGFAIAGADQQWHWAQARIAGDRVIVSHPDVKVPVAVRYAWADNPDCNLYNGAGLPASPFTTDDAK